jgi:chromosome segregation ATPase
MEHIPLELPDTDNDINNNNNPSYNELLTHVDTLTKDNVLLKQKLLKSNNDNTLLKKTISNLVYYSKTKNKIDNAANAEEVDENGVVVNENSITAFLKEKSYADLVLQVPQIKNELELLLNQLSNYEALTRSLQYQKEKLVTSNTQYESDLNKMKDELTQLREDNESLITKLNIKNEKVEHYTTLIEENEFYKKKNIELMKEVSSKENEKEVIQLKYNDLSKMTYDERVKDLEMKVEHKQNEINECNDIIHKLESQLQNERNVNEDNIRSISLKEQEINDLTFKNKTIENEKNEITKTLNSIIQRNEDLEQLFKDANNRNDELSQVNNSYKKDLILYENELNNLNNRLILLNSDKNKNETYYLSQISLMQQQINTLENYLSELNTKKDNESHISTTSTRIESEQDAYASALDELLFQRQKNERLAQDIQCLNNDMNSLIEENQYYYSLIKKVLIEDIDNDNKRKMVEMGIEVYSKIARVMKRKKELKSEIQKYKNFVNDMNSKNSLTVMKYSMSDMKEVSNLQQQLMGVETELSQLNEKLITINQALNI